MNVVSKAIALVFLFVLISSCDDQGNPYVEDWRNAPEPFDVTGINPFIREDGLKIYEITTGSGPFEIMERDIITVEYTGRTRNGRVFISTFSRQGSTTQDLNLNSRTSDGFVLPNEGFRDGIIGMRTGGVRRIVVPPNLGYGNRPNHPQAKDTLFYDVRVRALLTE